MKKTLAMLLAVCLAAGLVGVLPGTGLEAQAAFVVDNETDWPFVPETITTDIGTFECRLWMGGPNTNTVSIVEFVPDPALVEADTPIDLVYPSELVVGDLRYPVLTARAGEANANIRSITYPDSVERLMEAGNGTYDGTLQVSLDVLDRLEVIRFGKGMRDLGGHLYNWGYGNYHIPRTITIEIDPANPYLTVVDNVIYSKDMTELLFVQDSLIGEDGTWHIPASVTKIGKCAFCNSKRLKHIDIPAQVTEVDDEAFFGCVTEPSVTFAPGSQLKRVGDYAFNTPLTGELILPDGLEEVGEGAFESLKVTKIYIPGSLKVLGKNSFRGARRQREDYTIEPIELILNEGLEEIGYGALCGVCGVGTLVLPSTVKRVGDYSLAGAFKKVVLPEGLEKLGEFTFSECQSLMEVNIPYGITEIPKGCFYNCWSLKMPEIPDTVRVIGEGAFALLSVASDGPGLASERRDRLEVPESVYYIGDMAFAGCNFTNGIKLPDSLVYLGYRALEFNFLGDDFVHPKGLTYITNNTFYGCHTFWRDTVNVPYEYRMTSVIISPDVTEFEDYQIPAVYPEVTIKGYDGTAAEEYAKTNGNPWVSLGPVPTYRNITIKVENGPDDSWYGCWADYDKLQPGTKAGFRTNLSSPVLSVTTASGEKIPFFKYLGMESGNSYDFYAFIMPDEDVTISYGERDLEHISSAGVDPSERGTAVQSTQQVEIDGKKVELQAYALTDGSGNRTNYVKVRDVAAALDGTMAQFNVGWVDGAVTLILGAAYTSRNGQENKTPYSGDRAYTRSFAETRIRGQSVGLQAFIILDDNGNGSTYYKLRDLGQALGFNVGWDKDRGIYIETDRPYEG